MEHDVEDFGPLTAAQLKELGEHPLMGESLFEASKEIEWLQNIVNNTPEYDVTYNRFATQLKQAQRYHSLKERLDTYGMGPTIDLTATFH